MRSKLDEAIFLLFSSGFRISRRLGLKSKSYGKGEDRYITISRKFDAAEIINELLRNGGSNEKYKLLPPRK